MSAPMPMAKADFTLQKQVLLVDDDVSFLEVVGQLFTQLSRGGWQLHLASSTARAFAILEKHTLDLVVVDVRMPVMDGCQFLQMLHRRAPDLAKVVMTGYGNDSLREAVLGQGADLYLEKPRQPEEYESVFAALNELATWQRQEGFRGMLNRVGLTEVIQMECLARNSCVLELISGEGEGRIYIQAGTILHAEMGDAKGRRALQGLLALAGGNFNVQPFSSPAEVSIREHWEVLVMEAARTRDEARDSEAASPPGPGAGPAPARPNSDHSRSIEEVVVCSGRSEVLYSWSCPQLEARIKLMHQVQQKGDWLAREWNLGAFDRLELEGPATRVVAQFQADRKLWVRTAPLNLPEGTP